MAKTTARARASRTRGSPWAVSARVRRACSRPRPDCAASPSTASTTWSGRSATRRRPAPIRPTTCTAPPTTSARWSRSSCGARCAWPRPGRAASSRRPAFRTRWSRDGRRAVAGDDPPGRERTRLRPRGRAARAAARRAARRPGPQGRQALVRYPGVRRVHDPDRWHGGERLHVSRGGGRRARRADGRGAGRGREASPAPAGFPRRRRRPVRLLHVRHAADGAGDARRDHGAEPRGRPALPARQPLPVHGLPEDRRGDHGRRGDSTVSQPPFRAVGRPIPRIDGLEKVTGRARYVTDLVIPGMAHAKVLRSPYAHARVRRVDLTRCRARPGVLAALCGADLTWCEPYYGPAYRDRPVLAIEEALSPGAPRVHTGKPQAGHFADLASLRPVPGTNVCHQFHFARGDSGRALASADLVLDETYRFPPVQHVALEAHAAVAVWSETDGLTVWASTQNPYSVRVELAKMFGVPLARIRVVVPHLGGGFGSKTYAKLEPLAAALARVAGRPGRLAVECGADYDVGAYADIGPRVVQKATYTATGPYRVPDVTLDARAVYTNTTPGGAFRGFGVPQLAWALESLFDVAAERLGRDPVELRRQNFLAHGEEFAPGDTPIDGKLEESLGRAAETIGWAQTGAADRGRGVAAMLKASVAPSVSEAIVRLHTDGSVTVLASAVEMGQGTRTVLAQIAAEVLSVPMASVIVVQPDTAVTPYDQTTSSSRSTAMTGRAVQVAAA